MTKLLEKFKLDDETRVVLAGHLFLRREGEMRSRIAIFHNSFQILDVIRYAIKEADLLSYKNKGKLALIVPLVEANQETCTYGISVSVEPSTDIYNYKNDIVVITMEKQDKRHYTDSLQLQKSKCRFYLNDYEMKMSFRRKDLIKADTFKIKNKRVEIQFSAFMDKQRRWFLDIFPEGWTANSFFISLFARGVKDNLNQGVFWYLADIENYSLFYIRASIEETWDLKGYQLIVLDVKSDFEQPLEHIELRQEKIYGDTIEISKKKKKTFRNRKRGKLKIVKKKRISEYR